MDVHKNQPDELEATIRFTHDNERWKNLGNQLGVKPREDGTVWDIVDILEALATRPISRTKTTEEG